MHKQFRVLAILLSCLLLQASLVHSQQPQGSKKERESRGLAEVQAKLGIQQLVLLAPDGYCEVSRLLPEFRAFADKLHPASQDLLAVYVPSDQVASLLMSESVEEPEYLLINTLRSEREKNVSPEAFERGKADYRAASERSFALTKEKLERLNATASDLYSKATGEQVTVSIDARIYLGPLADEAQYFSFGWLFQNTEVIAQEKFVPIKICIASTLLLKGKVLMLFAYTEFKGPKSIEAARAANTRYLRRLIQRNR